MNQDIVLKLQQISELVQEVKNLLGEHPENSTIELPSDPPVTSPIEPEISIATIQPEIEIALPPPDVTLEGELIIKSLLSQTKYPFCINPEISCSELRVADLKVNAEFASFRLNDTSFNVPIEKSNSNNSLCNNPIEYTPDSIRVLCEINNTGNAIPVLLKLINDDDKVQVIFGKDMESVVKEIYNG
jgi:hypothetical protein